MAKFVTIGERIHCMAPNIREALDTHTPDEILRVAKEQLDAGAVYLDVNIGPAEAKGQLRQCASVFGHGEQGGDRSGSERI